ncbi:MAG: CRISPR-associated endonuclease Cas1 [Candidatus Lokiarchaeota archaeon]|nr:CRISPR-associated endonuclease Cas1 [Candidatus Lokiarchaeota archaeon]
MDVILDTPGTRLGKRKDMLKISVPNHDEVEVPVREIESIIANKGVQITSQALQFLSSYAVNIIYTSLGKPYGIYTPFANVGTVFTRRQQLLAYEDWRGLHLASKFVYATIENKRKLLLYFAKNRKESNPKKYKRLRFAAEHLAEMVDALELFTKKIRKGERISNKRQELMGIEGRATAIYFREFGSLLPKEFKVLRRTRRPPTDPVNSLLSLGYTILLGYITTGIAAAGLELYGGFLHSDRSGKPSLALDLIEEFRQPIIDRFVARLIQKSQINTDNFENSIYGYRLKNEARDFFYKELRKEITGGKESELLFGDNQKLSKEKSKMKLNYKKEIVKQARMVANYLIGATSNYVPFIMNW